MATAIVKETPHPGIAQMIGSRGERARDLFFSRRQQIERLGEDVYCVPGSAGQRYTVRYGGPEGVEDCDCTDRRVHPNIPCKHLMCVALQYATRRAPRIPTAGDPIAHGGREASRLRELEDRLAHALLGDEERMELSDRINLYRKRKEH